ncbi:MAG: hypothetical protein E7666_07140 [Ruminococcaceae bacterium]|nr:hypothetical protein [Oscillospiraceae bacterium]
MKKVICFIIILLCFSLCSCRDYPLTSENFDWDFQENFFHRYFMLDPQLTYIEASPWEIELLGPPKPKQNYSNANRFYLSVIKDTPKEDFVAVTERDTGGIGGDGYWYRVYQREDAPVPMRDWTIKSISVFYYIGEHPFPQTIEDHEEWAQNPLGKSLFASGGIIKTYTQADSDVFLSSFSESYQNKTEGVIMLERNELLSAIEEKFNTWSTYGLLVRFEENDNLVWCVELDWHNDRLVCELSFYEPLERYHEIDQYLYIDAAFAEDILAAIEAADIPSKSGS